MVAVFFGGYLYHRFFMAQSFSDHEEDNAGGDIERNYTSTSSNRR